MPAFSSTTGTHVHGAARLVPHDELLIASDHAGAAEAHADHVPGVHRPSVALAHLTVRRSGERALDLCTGNGIQAILLAAHAEHVVATDVNERALAYATFNAALNGADNIETRAGSFFEPVEGEQFDLVVANPPYVVSPESAYLFRDGGMRGDAVSELVVRSTPATLAPGAFACVLIAWALDPGDPAERPRRWLEGSGCDAFLLHTSTDDPIETATVWNRDLVDRPEEYADALDRWLAYYRELGIERLGYACLVLRKRADGRDGWVEPLQLPRSALGPAGRHVERLFETHDRLARMVAGRLLLGRRLRVVDDAVVTQDTRFSGDNGTRRRSRSGSTPACPSPPSSIRRPHDCSESSTGRKRWRRPWWRRWTVTTPGRRGSRWRGGCSKSASSSSTTRGTATARATATARPTGPVRPGQARAPGPSSRSCPCGREMPPPPSGPARRTVGACRSRGRRPRSRSHPSP